MRLFLKILFLYLPALFAYYSFIVAFLVALGVVDNPMAFDPNDYAPVYQEQLPTGGQVTYHELK